MLGCNWPRSRQSSSSTLSTTRWPPVSSARKLWPADSVRRIRYPPMSSADIPRSAEDIGGYRILRTLSAGHSFLAEETGGQRVVLKVLDEDCLLRGQLHPNIHDRLERVRELAHPKVANLHSV